MKLNEYQEISKRTMPGDKHSKQKRLANYGMGLSGEAGETTDILKKHIFHGHELDIEALTKELGDTLHYLAGVASIAGISLEDVAITNIEKLKKRYPEGFSFEKSRNRSE